MAVTRLLPNYQTLLYHKKHSFINIIGRKLSIFSSLGMKRLNLKMGRCCISRFRLGEGGS